MSKNPHWATSIATAAIPLATLADLLLISATSVVFLATACLAFVVLQHQHVAFSIRRTAFVLGCLTVLLLPLIDRPLAALTSGVRIGGLIASILIAVSLLSRATLRVPRMRQVVTALFALPSGQRPLALGIGSQFLGGFLGLAGLTMMMDVAAQRKEVPRPEQIADFSAISRGYAALALWSPMYSNMSIALTLYDGILWTDVLPYALTISTLFIGLGTLLERLKSRAMTKKSEASTSVTQLLRDSLPIIALMLCFVVGMVWTSDRLHLSVSVIIIASVPLVAWLLNVAHPSDAAHRWRSGSRQWRQDFFAQSAISGEVLLFLISGCAGMVFSQAIPSSWIESISLLSGGSSYWGSLMVMATIVCLSGTSMHPMLSAVLVGSSLTPSALGLPPMAHLCAVLVGWGLAIITTPFSVISLMAARFSGIPIMIISLRANLVFVLVSLTGAALALGWVSVIHP